MKLSIAAPLATGLLMACCSASATPLSAIELSQLLSNSERPVKDSERDEVRKPAEVMHFAGVEQGDKILDLFAGGGWYSELFSMAVGSNGKVYAQNDSVIWRFAEKGITERTKGDRLANVTRLDKIDIVDMDIPEKSLDIAFTALNYHDLFFTYNVDEKTGERTEFREQAVDHKAALAKIKASMKDDGVFIIIDHEAIRGSGYDAPNSVHRIDSNIVKYQMAEAGFKLVEEAFYLRNPNDNKSINVFEKETRGKTDRFIYKFVKI